MGKNRMSGKSVHVCYIDFAKAFDSVSHSKLLYKLSRYGISGKLLLWIKSFLTNRTQTVRVENSFSTTRHVKSGIPQGTVLGPLLFLLYVNDLPDCVTSSKMSLYMQTILRFSGL